MGKYLIIRVRVKNILISGCHKKTDKIIILIRQL